MCLTEVKTLDVPPPGSRRRRMWEFDGHAHCPVVGVCLPIATLRRLVDKVLGGQALASDYELHCGVIAECKRRSRLAEAVQKELDRRYLPQLRQAALAKSSEALLAWWQQAAAGKDVAGALWAVLSHARCTPVLETEVLGDVHMLQHQLGVARRADLQRLDHLADENHLLSRELAATQQRHARALAEQAQRADALQAEVLKLRAELIGRDTANALLREQLATMEAATPGLKSRFELVRLNEQQAERVRALEQALLQARHDNERLRRQADEAVADVAAVPAPSVPLLVPEPVVQLNQQAVLCVGGRPASVPQYRELVERTGGRFLHHDGGDEDNVARLDATLAAADLVICQTGCISHDAYWRVKDHCKRTGKRCVFVESPSAAGLKRALVEAAR